jgi:hypothetical protein
MEPAGCERNGCVPAAFGIEKWRSDLRVGVAKIDNRIIGDGEVV